MKHTIYNRRKQEIGWVENGIYHSRRNWSQGQIFHNPKYKSSIGLDTSIVKDLIKNNVHTIRIEIVNFEKYPFMIEIDIMDFLRKSKTIDFDKKLNNKNITRYSPQRIVPMNEWTRYYPTQTKLK